MDQGFLREIRTFGQGFRNSPSEKFLLMILGSQAKLDNDNKSVNVKRGLRMRCELGLWPVQAPTGYLNMKTADQRGVVVIDPERAPVIRQIFEKVAYERWSGRKVHDWLKFELNFKSPLGNKNLTLSNVHKILEAPFYYGSFEYPMKSGNWYTGRHEPIITKELYDAARAQLKPDCVTRESRKEFAFAKIGTCGKCGSGICGERKEKPRKDSSIAVYTYYGCNRSRDRNCKSGYMREDILLEQLLELVDELEWDEDVASICFSKEYERMKRFQHIFLKSQMTAAKGFEVQEYARCILQIGTVVEQRELFSVITTRLVIENKQIYLIRSDNLSQPGFPQLLAP